MIFRHTAEFIAGATGQMARRLRGMLSRRDLDHDGSTGDRIRALGREAFDGSVETLDMDAFAPVGLIARPSSEDTVESAVGFVGADGSHPVALCFLDHGRRAVINAAGLDADETLVYTSQAFIKLGADGSIELRTISGTAVALALKSDADALNARIATVEAALNAFIAIFNTHTQPVVLTPLPVANAPSVQAVPSASSAVIAGTAKVRAE
jgi:phage gp45-like